VVTTLATGVSRSRRRRRLIGLAGVVLAVALTSIGSVDAVPAALAPVDARLVESSVQGRVCLAETSASDLNHLFDAEPGGVVGADYQRPFPLPDGRVLWVFQDGAVRTGPDSIVVVHNIALLQNGSCFEVLYGGTPTEPKPFLFASQTEPFRHWFWPLDAEIGTDGKLYVFVAEMVEQSDTYLTRTVPIGTHVVAFDPATNSVTWEGRPANSSPSLYGWSITSDEQWTYLYAQCHRQFGFDQYALWAAFDAACSPIVTVGRVPRGNMLDSPSYWDGSVWQPDPAAAVPVVETAGRRVNVNQIEWTGSSFLSVNKEGDWWGDTIYFARAESATGPFVVYDSLPEPLKCPRSECNSFFATWIPRQAVDRPGNRLVFSISHNRWDGVISALYRPSFHEVVAPPFLGAGQTLELTIPGDPVDAAVINVTAVHPTAAGYVTAYPCDRSRPETSNLNYLAGDVVANLVVARPDADGKVCLFSFATTDLVVDLAGGFQAGSGYDPVDNPVRLIDTRHGLGVAHRRVGAGETIKVSVPGDPLAAAVLNVTAVSPSAAGYITVFPCDRPRPDASNLNYSDGDVVANLVVARPDVDNNVCLFSFAETDVVVDLAGGVALGGSYNPADNPTRLVDSRRGLGTSQQRVAGGETVVVSVPDAAGASAVVFNVTAVSPSAAGYITAYPCDRSRPETSNLNYSYGDVVANLAVTRPDTDGNVCLFSFAETDLIVDLAGTVPADGTYTAMDTPSRIVDTRTGIIAP
jgi:hypothetical protein